MIPSGGLTLLISHWRFQRLRLPATGTSERCDTSDRRHGTCDIDLLSTRWPRPGPDVTVREEGRRIGRQDGIGLAKPSRLICWMSQFWAMLFPIGVPSPFGPPLQSRRVPSHIVHLLRGRQHIGHFARGRLHSAKRTHGFGSNGFGFKNPRGKKGC